MLRRFAGSISNRDYIKTLNPVERWNVDNLQLLGSDITLMTGIYNGLNLSSAVVNRPTFDEINNEVDFNGVDEELILNTTLNPPLVTDKGELIGIVKYDPNPSNPYFGMVDELSNRLLFFGGSNGFEILNQRNSPSINNRVYAEAFKGVGYYIVSFISTGSAYKIFLDDPVNERSLTLVNGLNDGIWTDSQPDVNTRIGQVGAGNYRSLSMKDMIYFDRVLTDAEREEVYNILNSKYNIY